MSVSPSIVALRLAYAASQLPRIGWYMGQGFLMQRLADATRRQDHEFDGQRRERRVNVPDRRQIYADMAALLRQDLANIEAGRIVLTPHAKRPRQARIMQDPVTGLPVLSAGADVPELTGKEIAEILTNFP